jgi:hypothetical protein
MFELQLTEISHIIQQVFAPALLQAAARPDTHPRIYS